MPFDIQTAIPSGDTLKTKEFDLSTANPVEEISADKDTGIFDRLGHLFASSLDLKDKIWEAWHVIVPEKPEEAIARAQDQYSVAKANNIPLREVVKDWDAKYNREPYTGFKKEAGMKEIAATAMAPMIGAGFIEAPVTTAVGLATFSALEKYLNIDNYIPKDINSDVRGIFEAADIIGKLWLSKKVMDGVPWVSDLAKEAFFINKITDYNLPKVVELSTAQARDIFQTGELTSVEQKELFASLGLQGPRLRAAIDNGVKIQVPAEKIVTLTDKPWWGKFKEIIGREPAEAVYKFELAGKTSEAPFGLIEGTIEGPAVADLVSQGGGVFRGISDMKNTIYRDENFDPVEPTVYFDGPNGSTLTLPLSKVTPEMVAQKIQKSTEPPQPAAGGMTGREIPEQMKRWMEKGVTIIERMAPIRIIDTEAKIRDISGQLIDLPKGHEMTPYKLSNGKIWLHDGKDLIVESGQLQNLMNQNLVLGSKKLALPEDLIITAKGEGAQGNDVRILEEQLYNLGFQTIQNVEDPSVVAFIETGNKDLTEFLDSSDITNSDARKLARKIERIYASGFGTKYGQHTLPGGKNYKEILLRSPVEKPVASTEKEEGLPEGFKAVKNVNGYWEVIDPYGRSVSGGFGSREEAVKNTVPSRRAADLFALEMANIGQFSASHWDEPNVLAHLRTTERTVKTPEDTLMLEEVQSDWALKVRKEGEGVPGHPLLKDWLKLVLKKAIYDAVMAGKKYLTWTTGEQQADRYNLSKFIDTIDWKSVKKKSGKLEYKEIAVYPKDRSSAINMTVNDKGMVIVSSQSKLEHHDLSEVVGKDVAEKILAKEFGSISEEGLKIGGEWAKNLYDKQIPSTLKEILKPLEVEVKEVTIKAGKVDKNAEVEARGEYGISVRELLDEYDAEDFDEITEADLIRYCKQEVYSELESQSLEGKVSIGDIEFIETDSGNPSHAVAYFDVHLHGKLSEVTEVIGEGDQPISGTVVGTQGKLKASKQQALVITPEIRELVLGPAPKAGGMVPEPKFNLDEVNKEMKQLEKTLETLERVRDRASKQGVKTKWLDQKIENFQKRWEYLDSIVADTMISPEKKKAEYRPITTESMIPKELKEVISPEEAKKRIHPKLEASLNRIKQAIYDALGLHMHVTSGIRTAEYQRQLQLINKNAEAPELSEHVKGNAADVVFMDEDWKQAKWKAKDSTVVLGEGERFLTGDEMKTIKSIFRDKGFKGKEYPDQGHIHVQLPREERRPSFGEEWTPEQRKTLWWEAKKKGLIYTTPEGKEINKLTGILRFYREASFEQLKNYVQSLVGAPKVPPKIFKLTGDIDKDAEVMRLISSVSDKWVDINPVEMNTLDPVRIIEKVTGQDISDDNILADNTFNTISGSDLQRFDALTKWVEELDKVAGDIKKGSKESAEIMRKFEAKEQLTPKEQAIVDYLRGKYDELIKMANEVRGRLGKKLIPYRKDYMTHIIERNMLEEFFKGDDRNMEKISPEQLDAIRKGDYTKGNMPFNRFAQKRLGNETKMDAIGNYLEYLNTIMREIYTSQALTHARKFIEYALVKQPNAYKSLDRLFNELKGKPSIIDNGILGVIASMKVIKNLRGLVSKSALLGNLSFWLTNASNWTMSYDELGNYLNRGMTKWIGDAEFRKFALENSIMLKNRQVDPDLDPSTLENLESAVGFVTTLIEDWNVGITFAGAYIKATEELGYGQKQAILYADSIARRTQVGYKPYELNAWMRSNSGKILSQFQTWSFNAMNHVLYDLKMKDVLKGKARWKAFWTLLATILVVNWIYDKMGKRRPYGWNSFIPSIPYITKPRYEEPAPKRLATNIAAAITSKKAKTRRNAAIKAIGSVVPMGTQLSRFATGTVFPSTKKKQTGKFNRKPIAK